MQIVLISCSVNNVCFSSHLILLLVSHYCNIDRDPTRKLLGTLVSVHLLFVSLMDYYSVLNISL